MTSIISVGMQAEMALRAAGKRVVERDGGVTAKGLQDLLAVAERQLRETGSTEGRGVISQVEIDILKDIINTASDENLKPVDSIPEGNYVKELKLDRGYNQLTLKIVDGDVFLNRSTSGINPGAAMSQNFQLV